MAGNNEISWQKTAKTWPWNSGENVTVNHKISLGEKLETWQKTAKSCPWNSGENVTVNHKISLGKKLQNHGRGTPAKT